MPSLAIWPCDDLLGTPMGIWKDEPEGGGLAAHISKVAEGLSKLLTELVTLARLELTQDAKTMARQAALIAGFVPFLLLGYTFLCLALTLWLTRGMALWAAFLWVGGGHLVLGGAGVALAIRRLRARPLLDNTV